MKIECVRHLWRNIVPALLVLAAAGVSSALAQSTAQPQTTKVRQEVEKPTDPAAILSPQAAMNMLDPTSAGEYTIGEGDEVDIQVVGRPELSGNQQVGPDGRITLPIAGSFEIKEMTREDAARKITTTLERYYTSLDVTVRVSKYAPYRILVLGNVDQQGPLYFENAPTLLDVLSKSRRTPMGQAGQSQLPKRCQIFRGKDQVVWIDLKSMTDGGAAVADFRLRRNDSVYVPDEQDDQISVLGVVNRPGIVKLQPKTTLTDVLAMSGGLVDSAGKARIEIVRPSTGVTREISISDLVHDPAKAGEMSLQGGDIVYVQRGTMAKFAYALQQIAPAGGMLMFAAAMKP